MNSPIPDDLALQRFARDGYLVLRGALDAEQCGALKNVILDALNPLIGPAEFEADVGYPGAPAERDQQGGHTPRRLLHAVSRDRQFLAAASQPQVVAYLKTLLGGSVVLSQCHHNCVMTKHPGYSSATLWHQDIRYWSFDEPELVSAWFALGEEQRHNGALRVIPGSHLIELDRGRLDRDLFLRPELEENRTLIRSAETVTLAPGDVLLFHCRTYHAAGKNLSDQVKLSPVFTYHHRDNQPIPGTRSASYPGIEIA